MMSVMEEEVILFCYIHEIEVSGHNHGHCFRLLDHRHQHHQSHTTNSCSHLLTVNTVIYYFMQCDYNSFILSAVNHWCIQNIKEHGWIICVHHWSQAFHFHYSYIAHNLWWTLMIHLYPLLYLCPATMCVADCCWGVCSIGQNRRNCAFGRWRKQSDWRTDEVSGPGASSCPCPHRGWLIKGK
jgi:hypothetical protein